MLYYDGVNVFGRVDIKTSKSKECDNYHYLYK